MAEPDRTASICIVAFVAIAVAVVIAVIVAVVTGLAEPNPWISISGGTSYRCEATTAIYRQDGIGQGLTAVSNDPRCAHEVKHDG